MEGTVDTPARVMEPVKMKAEAFAMKPRSSYEGMRDFLSGAPENGGPPEAERCFFEIEEKIDLALRVFAAEHGRRTCPIRPLYER
jgi:hypothetical protein